MKNSRLVNKLAEKLSITNTEFIVIFTLIIGLGCGMIYKMTLKEIMHYPIASVKNDALLVTLDSIAEIHKTTFIGSNIDNEPVEELAKADTVAPRELAQRIKKADFKGVVNINTASKSQLMQLYRIGEKNAEKIIEHRTQNPFTKKEDIMKVSGIGEKTFEKIKDNITV